MQELIRTNDPVLLSYVEKILAESGIRAVILDTNMSVLEGSLGMLPRRLLVPEGYETAARRIIREADLGQWLIDEKTP
jgi:putative signal transducing protein